MVITMFCWSMISAKKISNALISGDSILVKLEIMISQIKTWSNRLSSFYILQNNSDNLSSK